MYSNELTCHKQPGHPTASEIAFFVSLFRKRPVMLSITHKLSSQDEA